LLGIVIIVYPESGYSFEACIALPLNPDFTAGFGFLRKNSVKLEMY